MKAIKSGWGIVMIRIDETRYDTVKAVYGKMTAGILMGGDKYTGNSAKAGSYAHIILDFLKKYDCLSKLGDVAEAVNQNNDREAVRRLVLAPYSDIRNAVLHLKANQSSDDSYIKLRRKWLRSQRARGERKKELMDEFSLDVKAEMGGLDLVEKNAYRAMCDHRDDKSIKLNVKLLRASNLRVCPYCGMEYIGSRGNQVLDAQLDHFFSKSLFPAFSICLYNLVPSCATCNNGKSNKDVTELVSPHDQNADFDKGIKIKYFPNPKKVIYYDELDENGNMIEQREGDNCVQVTGIKDGDKDYEQNVRMFRLQRAYEYQGMAAKEYLSRMDEYDEALLEVIKKRYLGTKVDLERDLFTHYFDEPLGEGNKPLASMYRWLYEQYRK